MHSQHCLEWLGIEVELQVCRSAAGYYIGAWSNEEGPLSRDSKEYWRTEAEATEALRTGNWTQRDNP